MTDQLGRLVFAFVEDHLARAIDVGHFLFVELFEMAAGQ